MKIIILLLLLLSEITQAQIGSAGPGMAQGTGMTHGHNATIHGPDAQPTPFKNKVFGQCTVVAGNGNMLGGPCGNIVLFLQVGKNKDVQNTRTTSTGYFEFNAPQSDSYKLGVSSRLYEVISPSGEVQSGEKIDVQLRQK